MPKYRPETAKLKAKSITKDYSRLNYNQTKLAKKEGVTSQAICQRLKRPPVKKALIELADKMGLSDSRLMKKHNQLLDAKRVQSCDVYVQNDDGKYKINENSNDFIEVDDNNAQSQALKLAYQIKGHLKENGTKIEVGISINLTPEERDARINRVRALIPIDG